MSHQILNQRGNGKQLDGKGCHAVRMIVVVWYKIMHQLAVVASEDLENRSHVSLENSNFAPILSNLSEISFDVGIR